MTNSIVPFNLVDITTEQFAVFKENYNQENHEYDIELKTTVNVSSAQKAVGVLTKYSFSQKSNLVVIIECGCHFNIDEDYWQDNKVDEVLTLNINILTHLFSLTVGTSRGILHAKKPKWMTNLILPTINVRSIISKDMTFEL